jgi:hypothetical protein
MPTGSLDRVSGNTINQEPDIYYTYKQDGTNIQNVSIGLKILENDPKIEPRNDSVTESTRDHTIHMYEKFSYYYDDIVSYQRSPR